MQFSREELHALDDFSESHGYGLGTFFVQFSIYHESWEEYYIGDNKVCFIGEPSAYDEDVMTVMNHNEFCKYVVLYSEKYLQKHPEDKERIKNYLERKNWD
ncbi:ribonuclease toxin immunity protein CdiI [Paenibacillus melissococcoides]|uniref:ribonuclease toxin immunity protein CdiI n=1 Tax=Paenibacillus melissococcoides TaxID=2912268 RepID=UPI0036F3887D